MKDKFLKMAGVNSEEEFYSMFPTEEAFFQAYPEARQMKKGGNVPTNPELYSRVKSEAKSKFDRWPCVPVSTSKALTKEGWKSYFELEVGELILAYDMQTKTNKWTPILNLHYYENAPTVDIIKPGHNIKLTSTPDHKWVVYRKATGPDLIVNKNAELVYSLIQKLKSKEITFTEAKEYQSSIQEHYRKYKDCTWEEFLFESKFSKGGEFLITTEELRNGAFKQYVIRNAAPLDESYSDSNLKLTSKYNDNWTSNVLDMSRSQSEVWFASAIVYDGHQNKDYEVNSNGSKTYKTYGFKQKHLDHQDAFVASCILTGRRVRYGSYSENRCRNFYITERDYIPLDVVHFNDGESTDVWCPETEFGTWVMNQDGLVTITGNSAYGSAWLVKTYKSRGGGYRKAQTGGGLQDQQIFQYPNYNGNISAYYQKMNEDMMNNPMSAVGDFLYNGAMAANTAMNNAESNGGDKMQMAKLAMNVMGMPAMGMGGVGMMMRDNYYDEGGEMAIGQVMAMNDKIARLQNFINAESEVEPWVASKLTLADDYLTSVADYLQYNEGEEEEEEDMDMNMGEMEEMKMGGIPQRYKNRGFTKVGAKRKSDRAGKKWMVLAKKGDKYKIVHGGYTGMKDFSQHGSEKRKKNFWNRMGGKDSAKATDPFSPLYWHKRFGTWAKGGEMMPPEIARARFAAAGNLDKLDDYGYAKGGEPTNAGFQALPDYVQNKIMSKMAYGGDTDMYGGQMDMDTMYQMMKGGQPCYECGGKVYQQGGQQDEIMQAIQMYAQMTQTDPEQLIAQLQSLPALQQQEAIQKIMQAIQQAQAGQMKNGGIYINPANKGKFTESANRAGMGVQEFARHVLANKEDYSSTQVKRANFAHVFGGRNYQNGGYVIGKEYELSDEEIKDLINKGYKVEYI
jgi:hypothetical protein